MTRSLSTANEDATEEAHVPFVMLVDFDFSSGHVRLSSRDRSYDFNGNTYTAFGGLGSISPVKESANLSPEKVQFTLPGVNSALLQVTLAEHYHNRSVTVYVGYLDENNDLIDTPWQLSELRMDNMSISTGKNNSTITLVCENRLILWGKSAGWNYTGEHQNTLITNALAIVDNFFDQVASLMDKSIKWMNLGIYLGYQRVPQERRGSEDRARGGGGD